MFVLQQIFVFEKKHKLISKSPSRAPVSLPPLVLGDFCSCIKRANTPSHLPLIHTRTHTAEQRRPRTHNNSHNKHGLAPSQWPALNASVQGVHQCRRTLKHAPTSLSMSLSTNLSTFRKRNRLTIQRRSTYLLPREKKPIFSRQKRAQPNSSDVEIEKEEEEEGGGRGEVDPILAIELEDVAKPTRTNRVCLAGHKFFWRLFLRHQTGARLLPTSWAHF